MTAGQLSKTQGNDPGMLSIRLFGNFQAECNGQILKGFPSRKARDLLAYLALNHDVSHSRDRIADLFWSDSDEEHARRCLNTTLWRLQFVLRSSATSKPDEAYLQVTSRTLALDTTRTCQVDVAQFERCMLLAKQTDRPPQRMALYAQAAEIYRGELLPDSYDDWVVEARDRLQLQYLEALESLLDYYKRRDEHAPAISAATRILACDPLREHVHRRLIALHLANDEPALALKQYRSCAQALQAELQVEPSRETQALLPRVLSALPRAATRSSDSPALADVRATVVRLREAAAACEWARAALLEAASALADADSSAVGQLTARTAQAT